jgi:hypothetical protein
VEGVGGVTGSLHKQDLEKQMDDPVANIKRLRDAIDEALKDLHLDRLTFTLLPGENDNDLDTVGLVFKISPKALLSGEQLEIDDQFDKLISSINEDTTTEEKKKQIKDIVEDWMNEE